MKYINLLFKKMVKYDIFTLYTLHMISLHLHYVYYIYINSFLFAFTDVNKGKCKDCNGQDEVCLSHKDTQGYQCSKVSQVRQSQ